MAYDHLLADRIDTALTNINPHGLVSKKMFGGVGYMVQGNMACDVLKNKLIVCNGKPVYVSTPIKPDISPLNTTGHPMAGWVMVDASVITKEEYLNEWVARGVDLALTLPAK